jgi:hypothetical protein
MVGIAAAAHWPCRRFSAHDPLAAVFMMDSRRRALSSTRSK